MKCPVCENNTFNDDDYEYEICSECYWVYDFIQVNDPDYAGGANRHSLNDYRKIYLEQKAKKPSFSCKNLEDRELMVRLDREND